ncbi:hypothetical protein [Noviluteimonas gilva]|uniref:Uncharacterized protein n=1 Tax=Noviluteimonas gilva TaxID=2682097 RepID=A0A7C9LKL2_9GAMM|nr:hypothetical protein [Lysobacter gilvus]MUV13584.1 hypothetical protein [Lysobacter gilvus]
MSDWMIVVGIISLSAVGALYMVACCLGVGFSFRRKDPLDVIVVNDAGRFAGHVSTKPRLVK